MNVLKMARISLKEAGIFDFIRRQEKKSWASPLIPWLTISVPLLSRQRKERAMFPFIPPTSKDFFHSHVFINITIFMENAY